MLHVWEKALIFILCAFATAGCLQSGGESSATFSYGRSGDSGSSGEQNYYSPGAEPWLWYYSSSYYLTIGMQISIWAQTSGSITSCTSNPALPDGLALNPFNCEISGTPTTATPWTNYTVTASGSGGSPRPASTRCSVGGSWSSRKLTDWWMSGSSMRW